MAGLTQVEVVAISTFPAGPDNCLSSTAVAGDVLVHLFLTTYPRAARPRRVPTLEKKISQTVNVSAGVRSGFSAARQDLSEFENRIERDQTFLPQQVHSQSDEQCEPAVEQPVQAAGVRARATFRCRPSSEYRITNHNSGEKAPVDGWNCSWHTPRGNVAPRRKADLSPLYSIILHTRADKLFKTTHRDIPRKAAG